MLLVKTEIYNRVCKKCGKIFDPQWNLGEDLSFTERLKKVKVKLYCDTTLTIGHIGTAVFGKGDYNEQTRKEEVSAKLRIFGKRFAKPKG